MRVLALIVGAALVAAGCGAGDKKDDLSRGNLPQVSDTSGKRGGGLTVLSSGDVTSLDPGFQYFAYDYQALAHPTQRALYGWKPSDLRPSPDLAADMPQTSADGRTVTIKIKSNIRYSPPQQARTVTSEDVKYAIERTFLASVGNQYAATYYAAISGAAAFRARDALDITGITTPNELTLVLKLRQPVGVISTGQALSLPATIPVPKDYAQRYDRVTPSTYGAHQVFTGPYMIRNDAKGRLTGYKPQQRIELVRNPSWNAKSDHRPAYLDTITLLAGNGIDDASRRILSGQGLVSGDFTSPPVNVLRSALDTRADQLAVVPSQGVRYVALNTTVKPFDNVNVRRAVAAAIDRAALRLTRGGPPLGAVATHVLAPGLPGFEQAGATAGTFDFLRKPSGDLELARRYMRKAGYASGRYAGPPLSMVADDLPPASATGLAVQRQLAKLGLRFRYRTASRRASFLQFCGARAAKIAVCPGGEWGKDFFDPQSLLEPVFNGERIRAAGGANWSQIDDLELNAGFEIAASETDPADRAKAYAEIDRTVTGRAYVVPWLWDNQINSRSANVKGVVNRLSASWDLAYTSLR